MKRVAHREPAIRLGEQLFTTLFAHFFFREIRFIRKFKFGLLKIRNLPVPRGSVLFILIPLYYLNNSE